MTTNVVNDRVGAAAMAAALTAGVLIGGIVSECAIHGGPIAR